MTKTGTTDLLLEIGTEEIPAKFMPGILAQLEKNAAELLQAERIAYAEVRAVGTPRRLTLVVREVAQKQSDRSSENKGPAVKIAFAADGAPTKAAQGFARGQGVDVTELVVKDGYIYAAVREAGKEVEELLPALLLNIITSFNFPKNMRWADLELRFVRPIRWLVALFGEKVIPFTFAGVSAGNLTRGHRFLSSGEFTVKSVDDYFSRLAAEHVMVDQDVRRQVIREQVEKLAVAQGGTASIEDDLLEEVVFLVEYPTALCGSFEKEYLALPPEAIITPMREHQRYFPVLDAAGKLLPVFITVRNGGSEHIELVKHGNERVLRARLSDARFFFEEDRKLKLEQRVEKLKSIVFQEGLGSLFTKVERIQKLAVSLAKAEGAKDAEIESVKRAAYLAKADLVTGMVCEFTELQGVMGREYARLDGEETAVCEAIYEHYLPRFAGDSLPEGLVGRAVSIADKLDNIVATFSRGLVPTGSQDPYALRRQALGIVNTMIAAGYDQGLSGFIAQEMDLLGIVDEKRRTELFQEIQEFFLLRIKNILADENIRYDIVDAVLAVGTDNFYDTWLRAKALAENKNTKVIEKAVQAFGRAGNLAKKAGTEEIETTLFSEDAERQLFACYSQTKNKLAKLLPARDYAAVLQALAELEEPINAFFSDVMVMAEDPAVRANRLALLKKITALTAKVADLGKIIPV